MFSFEPSVSLSAGQLSTAPRGGPAGSLVDRNAIQVPKSPILFLLMRNVSFPLFINDVGRLVQGEIRMCIRPIEKEREKDGVIVLLLLSDRPSLSCLSGRSEPSNSPSAKETSGNETLFFRLPRILKKTGRDVVCKKRENSPIESSFFFFPPPRRKQTICFWYCYLHSGEYKEIINTFSPRNLSAFCCKN